MAALSIFPNQPINHQALTTVEIIVRIIATAPIILAVLLFSFKYLTPGQRPSGGRKMLNVYIPICLRMVVDRGTGFKFLPQFGQK